VNRPTSRSTIRRASPADHAALDRLQSELSQSSPDLLDAALAEVSPSETTELSPTSATADGTALSAFDLFVAVEEGTVVGYLLAVRGDPTHVAEVVVEPDHRRQGYGAALFDRLFAAVAERRDDVTDPLVRLAVSPDDDGARSFYRSLGFEAPRRDPDYYDGAPALLLVRAVGDESA
jgi:ribosomal-protein-alanine N-acetyltransferase